MLKQTPSVSVITTAYNAADCIESAIKSILTQTYDDFEYIIIDDGSDDHTTDIIESIDDDRIRLVKAGRLGRARALCEAVILCSGKYIANMDADDLSSPERLELQVSHMNNHPRTGILGSAHYQVYSKDKKILRNYPENNKQLREAMALYGPFCHSSVMYRTEAINDAGGFSSGSIHRIDYELWIKIAANGYDLANLSEPLVYHKKSDNTYFVRSSSEWNLARNMLLLNYKAIKLLRLPRKYYFPATLRFFWRFLPKKVRKLLVGLLSNINEKSITNIDSNSSSNDARLG